MHLCDIPEEAMNQLHLPNGLPLVYNVRGRCISLLDDGSGQDPMEKHDFGPAAKYLFKPCVITEEFYDSMLRISDQPNSKVGVSSCCREWGGWTARQSIGSHVS